MEFKEFKKRLTEDKYIENYDKQNEYHFETVSFYLAHLNNFGLNIMVNNQPINIILQETQNDDQKALIGKAFFGLKQNSKYLIKNYEQSIKQ